jgi:hypothetical protein
VLENERFVVAGIHANWGLPYLTPGDSAPYAGFLFRCYSHPFIFRQKFESKGPPGLGLAPQPESYNQHWTLVPVMDVDKRPLQFASAKEAFTKAIELADWFRGKV